MTKEEKLAMNKEKLKALQLTMDKIEKSYGKGSIMRLGDRPVDEVAAISSGSIALDVALSAAAAKANAAATIINFFIVFILVMCFGLVWLRCL